MFDTLTERLTQSLRNVTGSGQLTEDNIKDTLREVRMALLEADVALPVTREFIAKVKEEALGQEVMSQLSPGQAFVKIVHDELTKMMGEANESLDLAAKPPVVVLLAGLQGAGKTTTAAKLARFLQERQKKKVAMVSADVYRPAAINPTETLFVVDAMTGQDAANTAKAFNDALPLTGVILTKTDGDARGGAALSVRAITGKPIKFLGMGEKLDALEPFHPERVAQRILGMGDVLSLVEELERKVDKEKAEKMAKKLQKGGSFNFEDMLMQFEQMNKMGGMMGFLDKLPGMSNSGIQDAIAQANPEKQVKKMEAIIQSMTIKERRNPDLMNPSRKKRIAAGCGMDVAEVNKLIKQHAQMAKMMKKFANPSGMAKMMKSLSGMQKKFGGGGGVGPLFGGKDPK